MLTVTGLQQAVISFAGGGSEALGKSPKRDTETRSEQTGPTDLLGYRDVTQNLQSVKTNLKNQYLCSTTKQLTIKEVYRKFPWWPNSWDLASCLGVWVRSPVGELRSHTLLTKKQKQNEQKFLTEFSQFKNGPPQKEKKKP